MSKECNYLHVFCNKWLRFNVFEFKKVKHAIWSCTVGIPKIWDCTVRKKPHLRLSRKSFYLKSPLLQSTELLQCIIRVLYTYLHCKFDVNRFYINTIFHTAVLFGHASLRIYVTIMGGVNLQSFDCLIMCCLVSLRGYFTHIKILLVPILGTRYYKILKF